MARIYRTASYLLRRGASWYFPLRSLLRSTNRGYREVRDLEEASLHDAKPYVPYLGKYVVKWRATLDRCSAALLRTERRGELHECGESVIAIDQSGITRRAIVLARARGAAVSVVATRSSRRQRRGSPAAARSCDLQSLVATHAHLVCNRGHVGRRSRVAVLQRHRDTCSLSDHRAAAPDCRTRRASTHAGHHCPVLRAWSDTSAEYRAFSRRNRRCDETAQLGFRGVGIGRDRADGRPRDSRRPDGSKHVELVREVDRRGREPDRCRAVADVGQQSDHAVPAPALVLAHLHLGTIPLARFATRPCLVADTSRSQRGSRFPRRECVCVVALTDCAWRRARRIRGERHLLCRTDLLQASSWKSSYWLF